MANIGESKKLNSTMVAIYEGDEPVFVGEFKEALVKLGLKRDSLKFLLTPAAQKRSLAGGEKRMYAMRVPV